MLIKRFEKIYQSPAFHYPENDRGDEYEPDLPFIKEYLEIEGNSSICLGVHLYKLHIAKNIETIHSIFEVINSVEFKQSTGYEVKPEMLDHNNVEQFIEISNFEIELNKLFYRSFLYNRGKKSYAKSIKRFISQYIMEHSKIYKYNFGYSSWFANDSIDFFYCIVKDDKLLILGFYESD